MDNVWELCVLICDIATLLYRQLSSNSFRLAPREGFLLINR